MRPSPPLRLPPNSLFPDEQAHAQLPQFESLDLAARRFGEIGGGENVPRYFGVGMDMYKYVFKGGGGEWKEWGRSDWGGGATGKEGGGGLRRRGLGMMHEKREERKFPTHPNGDLTAPVPKP